MRNDFNKSVSELINMGYSLTQLQTDAQFSLKELYDSNCFTLQDFVDILKQYGKSNTTIAEYG